MKTNVAAKNRTVRFQRLDRGGRTTGTTDDLGTTDDFGTTRRSAAGRGWGRPAPGSSVSATPRRAASAVAPTVSGAKSKAAAVDRGPVGPACRGWDESDRRAPTALAPPWAMAVVCGRANEPAPAKAGRAVLAVLAVLAVRAVRAVRAMVTTGAATPTPPGRPGWAERVVGAWPRTPGWPEDRPFPGCRWAGRGRWLSAKASSGRRRRREARTDDTGNLGRWVRRADGETHETEWSWPRLMSFRARWHPERPSRRHERPHWPLVGWTQSPRPGVG